MHCSVRPVRERVCERVVETHCGSFGLFGTAKHSSAVFHFRALPEVPVCHGLGTYS